LPRWPCRARDCASGGPSVGLFFKCEWASELAFDTVRWTCPYQARVALGRPGDDRATAITADSRYIEVFTTMRGSRCRQSQGPNISAAIIETP
jgi:hypothetical protein